MNTKPIIIVAGDPQSIFYEIFFKSLQQYKSKRPLILIGSIKILKKQMKILKFNFKINILDQDFNINQLLKNNGINSIDIDYNLKNISFKRIEYIKNYTIRSFDVALKIINKYKISGLINGPVSKEIFLKTNFLGVTDFLSFKTKSKDEVMLIYSKKFSVSPVTTHLSIKDISKNLKMNKIINNVKKIKSFYYEYFKKDAKILITGLNPHCESKYSNNEEKKIIIPAIKKLKKIYKKVDGPVAADSLFMKKNLKNFDVVVGMYHDQVLTPAKTLNNFKAINITLGLPFIRISPDHGPNKKMVGKNISNHHSLLEAIKFLNF